MENIDSELLLNYYFKDGYLFSCPNRLFWDKAKALLDSSLKDIQDNYDYYYQLYLDEIGDVNLDGFIDER